MKNFNMKVVEYRRFQLKQYIYKLISPSCKGQIWKFSKKGLFWFPEVKTVYFTIIEDCLAPKAAGLAFSMLVCLKLTWEYCDCLPKIADFWSDYYEFLKQHVKENFSNREQEKIFSFLKAEFFKLEG